MKHFTRNGGGRRGRNRRRTARGPKVAPEHLAYMEKIDGYRAGRDPLALMRAGPGRIARAVAGLTPPQLARRPSVGKWSIGEILGHLLDTEVVYGYRIRRVLAQPGEPIELYDQEAWVDVLSPRGKHREPKRVVRRIRALRAVLLETAESVPRGWWSRYGLHGERGRETVRRTLELIAGHDLNHLAQIRAIRRRFDW